MGLKKKLKTAAGLLVVVEEVSHPRLWIWALHLRTLKNGIKIVKDQTNWMKK